MPSTEFDVKQSYYRESLTQSDLKQVIYSVKGNVFDVKQIFYKTSMIEFDTLLKLFVGQLTTFDMKQIYSNANVIVSDLKIVVYSKNIVYIDTKQKFHEYPNSIMFDVLVKFIEPLEPKIGKTTITGIYQDVIYLKGVIE